MSVRTHFVMMTQFHRWATRRMLTSLGVLDDPLFRPIRQAMVPVIFSPATTSVHAPAPREIALDALADGGVSSAQLAAEHPYMRDLSLPCGSIHGTLCHLYYAEQLWFMRLTGQTVPTELSNMWSANDSTAVWANHFVSQHTGLAPSAGTAAAAKAAVVTPHGAPNNASSHANASSSAARPLPFNTQSASGSGAGFDAAAAAAQAVSVATGAETPYSVGVSSLRVVPIELSVDVQMSAQKARNAIGMRLDDQNNDWLDLVRGLPDSAFLEKVKYVDTAGTTYSRTRMALLTHVLNHATWHRGQVSSALAQLGAPVPVLDLTAFMPEWEELHAKAFKWA